MNQQKKQKNQCTFERGGICCKNTVKGKGFKLCKYHFSGGDMMSSTLYYSMTHRDWICSKVCKPLKGDLKSSNDVLYINDGNQWRKTCQLCDCVARPEYCRKHDPVNLTPVSNSNFSLMCCRFMDKLSNAWKKKICHIHVDPLHGDVSGSEYEIPGTPYKADGFLPQEKIIIEFLGDYWHGNPLCYLPNDVNKSVNKTYGELWKETFRRFRDIFCKGYTIYYAWEQDYKALGDKPIEGIIHQFTMKDWSNIQDQWQIWLEKEQTLKEPVMQSLKVVSSSKISLNLWNPNQYKCFWSLAQT